MIIANIEYIDYFMHNSEADCNCLLEMTSELFFILILITICVKYQTEQLQYCAY